MVVSLVELRVVFEDLLGIVGAAGSEFDVADDRATNCAAWWRKQRR